MSDQALQSLTLANRVRSEQAAIKGQLRRRELTIADLLFTQPRALRNTPLTRVLSWLPGVGKVRVTRTLRALGISEGRRFGALTERERSAVLGYLREALGVAA